MASLRSQFEPAKPEGSKLRKRFSWLNSFNDEELLKISLCTIDEGEKQANEDYFDLSRPELGAIRGRSGAIVPEGSCYISKGRVGEKLWNKLLNDFAR
ncbi:MAG: hypothetical protein M1358_09945 [Chloroflexi bacterium]|nr:hypothetical protein [Chloroflexota bacterium]